MDELLQVTPVKGKGLVPGTMIVEQGSFKFGRKSTTDEKGFVFGGESMSDDKKSIFGRESTVDESPMLGKAGSGWK